MSDNRVVAYKGPGTVAVEAIPYPKLEIPKEVADWLGISKAAPHAAILKVVTTNICGSDQHMVRGRTTAPVGQSLGHLGRYLERGHVVVLDLDDARLLVYDDLVSTHGFRIPASGAGNLSRPFQTPGNAAAAVMPAGVPTSRKRPDSKKTLFTWSPSRIAAAMTAPTGHSGAGAPGACRTIASAWTASDLQCAVMKRVKLARQTANIQQV